jgi:HK97 family phage portal protein
MIVRSLGANVELRSADATVPPPYSGSAWSYAGVGVTVDNAFGVSAVTAAIRLVAETVGSLPVVVYQGRGAAKKPASSSWQFGLLGRAPSPGLSSRFDFYSGLAVSVEGWGNAFVRKTRRAGEVLSLDLLDPTLMHVRYGYDGALEYHYRSGRSVVELAPAEVLHVRGFRVPGSPLGLSPIGLHRHQLGAAIALDEFTGEFFRNGAQPGGVISAPAFTQQQANEFIALWRAQHSGEGRRHLPAMLYGGMTWQAVGVNLEDARAVESSRFSVEQVARMWRVPAALIGAGEAQTTEEDSLRFLNFSLLPRLKRIEDELLADPDLFPTSGADLYPEFQLREFLRADAATRAEVQHKQVQSGVLLVDEARAEEGRPPLPDGAGKIPQIVPVGGSPVGVPAAAPAEPAKNGDGAP